MRSLNKQPKKPFFIVSAYIGRSNRNDVERSSKLEQEFKAMKVTFTDHIKEQTWANWF